MRATRPVVCMAAAAGLHASLLVAIRPIALPAPPAAGGLVWMSAGIPPAVIARALPTPPPLPRTIAGSPHVPLRPRAPPAAEPRATAPPAPATAPPVGRDRGPIDLFPPSALGSIVGPPPAPDRGGRSRRAGDGQAPDPDAAAGAGEAERLHDRVGRWLSDAAGEERARAGSLAPHWRDIERQVDARFHPAVEQVTDAGSGAMLLQQYRRGLAAAPTTDPSAGARAPTSAGGLSHWEDVQQQIRDGQRRFAEPGDWRRVEVEVRLDGEGRRVDARVVATSGRRALDGAALEAVRRAAELRPERDPRGPVRARFVVEAAVSIEPPQVSLTVDPLTGKPEGGVMVKLFGLSFDESSGKIGGQHVLRRTVHTRVRLTSVTPEP